MPNMRLQGDMQELMLASATDASAEAAAEGTQPGESTSSGSDSDAGQEVDIAAAAAPEDTAATAPPDAAAHAVPALPAEARCLLLHHSHAVPLPLYRLHGIQQVYIVHGWSCFGKYYVRLCPAYLCMRSQEVNASAASTADHH